MIKGIPIIRPIIVNDNKTPTIIIIIAINEMISEEIPSIKNNNDLRGFILK